MTGANKEQNVRRRGRRARDEPALGRDHLIESTRDAMRRRPKFNIQRREIAKCAGVTPALVSYYFPDKDRLLRLAAKPVVEAYAEDVRQILRSAAEPKDKLIQIVSVVIDFNSYQKFIIEHYPRNGHPNEVDETTVLMGSVQSEIVTFFTTLIDINILSGDDPRFLVLALWAICRHIGTGADENIFSIEYIRIDRADALARKVVSLITN